MFRRQTQVSPRNHASDAIQELLGGTCPTPLGQTTELTIVAEGYKSDYYYYYYYYYYTRLTALIPVLPR